MKPQKLLWLALAVVAMGLFIYFFERDVPSTEERKAQAEKVLRIKAGEVRGLSWTWGDAKVELLRNSGGGDEEASQPTWRLIEPYRAQADDIAVDALVGSLLEWKLESQIGDGEADRAEIGLVEPRAELRLETSQGDRVVHFGAALPVGQAMVVEVEGHAPVVVSDAVWSDLSKAPGEWRSKEIWLFSRDDLQLIRLENEASVLQLTSREDGFWLEEPLTDLADQDLVRALLGSLSNLRAESFVDDQKILAEAGLEPPVATIEIVLEDREEPLAVELGFEVANSEGHIYARVGDQAFTAGAALLEAARRSAQEWRSLGLATFDRWQIERIEIEDGQDSLLVERSGMDWQRNSEAIESNVVDDLLAWLTETRAVTLIDEALPRDEPAISCTLQDRDGRRETLSFFETDGGDVASNGLRTPSLLLSMEAIQELRRSISSVRSAEVRQREIDPESS